MSLMTAMAFAATGPPLLTYHLPPDKYRQAVEFGRRIDLLHFAGVAWDAAVLLLMIRLRIGARARDFAARAARRWTVQGLIAIGILLAITGVADLPLAVYRHHLGLRFGLSIESWPAWIVDWIKAGITGLIPATLLVLLFFAFARKAPRRWYLYAWALSVIAIVAGTFLTPLVIDPLFYRFRPLAQTDPKLVPALEQVVARAGMYVPPDRMFEMDASSKTREVNAYMTGLGSSKRIVIWDTTIAALTIPEIQSVFGHELGHYVLHHIPISIGLTAAGLLIAFWLLDWILGWIVRYRGARWDIRGLADFAILPAALLLALMAGFLSEPIVNSYSRWQERQADIYELEVLHGIIPDEGRNSAKVDQIMGEIDLDDPAPNAFVRFWLYDHPATPGRMLFAQRYDPWSEGKSPKYVK
jgi:Zn-dependent protease with chaperone function